MPRRASYRTLCRLGRPVTLAEIVGGAYTARPLALSAAAGDSTALAAAAWKANYIVRRCAEHEAFFSDYQPSGTAAARAAVIATLSKPDTLLWEVNAAGAPSVDLLGILRLSEIVPGCSARAHYYFFDQRLRDKTDLLRSWKTWASTPGAAWPGIHRVTVTIPDYAKALMRHAIRHLGFVHEGTMREAILWRGTWRDEHVLGCVTQHG